MFNMTTMENTTTLETSVKSIKSKQRRQLSHNGKAVARDVIATVRAGKRVNMQEIQIRNGYSVSSARAMKATQTTSYQEEIKPVIDEMERLRSKVLASLHRKDLDEAKVFDLNLLMKNLNHDLQLLNGKSTANHSHMNTVVVYGSDDFLALQMKQAQAIEGRKDG
jgi:excinuclease UvrABC nuclease subunit